MPAGGIVALIGNGAGKTSDPARDLGFLGLDDARVTDGAVQFQGERIENWPPHRVARLGIALVPERSKVFESLSVDENLDAAVARRPVPKDAVYDYFRRSPPCGGARPAFRAASGRCSASARR